MYGRDLWEAGPKAAPRMSDPHIAPRAHQGDGEGQLPDPLEGVMSHDRLFDYPTAAWAVRGALLGVLLIMGVFVVGIVISGGDWALLAVAAMSAVFGGVGMGAMLGATLAQFRQPEPVVLTTTPVRHRVSPSRSR